VFSLWHSSHESAKGEYSSFPKCFKAFLALAGLECQLWARGLDREGLIGLLAG